MKRFLSLIALVTLLVSCKQADITISNSTKNNNTPPPPIFLTRYPTPTPSLNPDNWQLVNSNSTTSLKYFSIVNKTSLNLYINNQMMSIVFYDSLYELEITSAKASQYTIILVSDEIFKNTDRPIENRVAIFKLPQNNWEIHIAVGTYIKVLTDSSKTPYWTAINISTLLFSSFAQIGVFNEVYTQQQAIQLRNQYSNIELVQHPSLSP